VSKASNIKRGGIVEVVKGKVGRLSLEEALFYDFLLKFKIYAIADIFVSNFSMAPETITHLSSLNSTSTAPTPSSLRRYF